MVKIGLLSDTHHFIHPSLPRVFQNCDEIWHAGDIGSMQTIASLKQVKPLRAVHGNADGHDIRPNFPLVDVFNCEGVKVLLMHIVGYPGKYKKDAQELIQLHQPQLVIAGHSHILKVMYDNVNQTLFMNPGACGQQGFHVKKTVLRFVIDKTQIKDLEVIELAD